MRRGRTAPPIAGAIVSLLLLVPAPALAGAYAVPQCSEDAWELDRCVYGGIGSLGQPLRLCIPRDGGGERLVFECEEEGYECVLFAGQPTGGLYEGLILVEACTEGAPTYDECTAPLCVDATDLIPIVCDSEAAECPLQGDEGEYRPVCDGDLEACERGALTMDLLADPDLLPFPLPPLCSLVFDTQECDLIADTLLPPTDGDADVDGDGDADADGDADGDGDSDVDDDEPIVPPDLEGYQLMGGGSFGCTCRAAGSASPPGEAWLAPLLALVGLGRSTRRRMG